MCISCFKKKFNAGVLTALEGAMHKLYGTRKRRLLENHPDLVVELGAGTGANFQYYRPETHIIAIEPNVAVHKFLHQKAEKYNLKLEVKGIKAERLDLDDACTQMVVGTLVLCTIDEPKAALMEAVRVLQPGGKYVFVEHVAAQSGGMLCKLQNGIQKPWQWLFDGCRPNRNTSQTLQNAGFAKVKPERFNLRTPALPINPHIAGYAVCK